MMSPAPARTTRTRGSRIDHAFDAERGEQRDIDPPQPRAGQPQLRPGGGVGVGRQHAFARRDRGERRGLRAAHLHRIERRDRVGAGRQRLADIDAGRRGDERRRRIGAGVERRVGAHRKAVAQRERGRADGRPRSRHRRQACARARAATRILARRDRPDREVEACQHVGERGQPRDPLDFGIRNHVRNLTRYRPGCPVSRGSRGLQTAPMAESKVNMRGLKCPLPALKTRKLLSRMAAGDVLVDRMHRSADRDRHSQSVARDRRHDRRQRQEGPRADVPDQEELGCVQVNRDRPVAARHVRFGTP